MGLFKKKDKSNGFLDAYNNKYGNSKNNSISDITATHDKLSDPISDEVKSKHDSPLKNSNVLIDRRKIPAKEIDRMQQIEASKKYRRKIYKMFYKGYPEMPFVSQDRELNANWIEQAQMFPKQSILKKSRMIRFSDGLLPGHIYMLYWLGKYTNRRIPAYFEYDYGIHFVAEKEFLKKRGYLNDIDKPTELGEQAIRAHYNIIEERHPKPLHASKVPIGFANIDKVARSIPGDMTPGINSIPDSDRKLIQEELKIINSLISKAIDLAHLNVNLKIDYSLLRFENNFTYYECVPYTKTGRVSKYPLILHYAYGTHNQPMSPQDYFGELKYLKNGEIGAARLIFWNRNNGYMITIGIIKNVLAIKKVEKSITTGWKVVYKLES